MSAERHLTDDEALLVRAALATGDEAARWWAAFGDLFAFDDIWDAERYSMLPAISVALRGVDGIAEAPRLAGIHRRTWVANQTAAGLCVAAGAALDDAGVAHCLTGGLALALDTYPDPATRVSGHPEVLVASRDVPAALGALSDLGWAPLADVDRALAVTDSLVVGRDADRLQLSFETCREVADADADRASVPAVIDGATATDTRHGTLRLTPPTARALTALTEGVGARPDHRLRAIVDLARLLDAGLDLDAVAARVDALGVVTVARHSLTVAGGLGVDTTALQAALDGVEATDADRRRHLLLIRGASPDAEIHPLRVARARHAVGRDSRAAARGLPGFLAATWDLDSPAGLITEVPRRAVVKAARALRGGGETP